MAKLLKLRRGTTSQHSSFTGAEGEVTVDTTKDTLVVHDGSTAGGVALAKESAVTAIPAVIDEDNMSTDSATRPPSQQSGKAYVDALPDVIDEDYMATDSATRPPSQQSVKAYAAPKAAPAFTGTATGVNLTLSGNLTVNGTTTTIASSTLDVEDKNIELGKVSTPTDATADGGGITLKGATDKEIKWLDASDAWTFNQNISTTGNITITNTQPKLFLTDTDNTSDFSIQNENGNLNFYDETNSTSRLRITATGGATFDQDVFLKDGKKLILGDDSDINIKHQSGQFELNNTTGNTYFQSNGTFSLRCSNSGTTETYLFANVGGSVDLYYNNVKTCDTHANGINVRGPEAGNAEVYLYADEGDDNADCWRLLADTSGNFKVGNKSTGSYVDGITLDGSNNATFAGTVSDSKGDLRKIIQNTQGSAYTLVAAAAGKHILASGNITVPDSVFAAGDAITIINNTGSNLTITKGTNLYNTGDGTNANRTLATRGMVTLLFTAADTAYISGAGLS